MATSTIQSNNKTIQTRQDEGGWNHYNLDQIVEYDFKTVIEDVKRLIEAKENGQTNKQLRREIVRLYRAMVDGHMKDSIIEESDRKCLSKLRNMYRRIVYEDRQQNKLGSTNIDSDKKKLDNELRAKWVKWFRKHNGINSKSPMEDGLYDAFLTAALHLDFIALQNSCKSDAQFYQNGLADCYQIAKNHNFYKDKPKPKTRTRKNYSLKGSPYITRKDWGSAYKPARG